VITLRQRWILALGAVFHQRDARSHARLGGLPRSWPNQLTCARELLSAWNVHDAEEARLALSTARARGEADPSTSITSRNAVVAYDAARRCLLAGHAFAVGHVTEAEAWEHLMPVAREVQATFGSFAEFGAAFLLGRARSTGTWGGPEERAYHELLAREDRPWRALPWDTDLADDSVASEAVALDLWAFELSAFFACPTCKTFVAVDRLAPDLPCVGCGASFSPSRNGWVQTIATRVDDIRGMPLGHVHRAFAAGNDYDATSRWVRVAPECPGCRGPLAATTLAQDGAGCTACGCAIRRSTGDPLLAEIHPELLAVLGERAAGASRAAAGTNVLIVECTGCGAPLQPESDRRLVTCPYCRKTEELSDEIWRGLAPPSPIPTLRIVVGSLRGQGDATAGGGSPADTVPSDA